MELNDFIGLACMAYALRWLVRRCLATRARWQAFTREERAGGAREASPASCEWANLRILAEQAARYERTHDTEPVWAWERDAVAAALAAPRKGGGHA